MATSTRDLNMKAMTAIGAAAVIIMVTLLILIPGWFKWEENQEIERKEMSSLNTELDLLKAQQFEGLQAQGNSKAEDGSAVTRLPLEDAKAKVLELANE